MRAAISLLATVVLLATLAGSALADDAPPFKVSDIAAADEDRPEGWSPVLESGLVPETAPTVKVLLALGKSAGLEDGALSARSRSIKKDDGTAAVISVVGIDAKSEAFTTALADASVKHGWKIRELGSPMRVALVWSSKVDTCPALMTWQAHLAVKKISAKVVAHLGARDLNGPGLLALLDSATAIEPKAGLPNSIRANIFEQMSNEDGALAAYRVAVNQDAPVPATPVWQLQAAGRIGHILLLKGDEKLLAEAAKALERAVELEEHARQPLQKFGNAYNLACAYSRMGRLDDAFKLLEKSLVTGKAILGDQYPFHFEHAREKDPDLQPLHGDPRWAALMKKYDPESADDDDEEDEEDGDEDEDKDKKKPDDGGGT